MDKNKWYLTVPYDETKRIITTTLQNMSRDFIAVGFYLKHVRDNEMYLEDGYKDIWEFAKDLYGIQRSTASRWMAINDKFSKDGNSPILLEQYQNFGKSQLQEMLYLPDEKLEQITKDMTVKEIRELKAPEPEEIVETVIEEEPVSILGYPLRVYPEGSRITTPGCGSQDCFSCHRDGCDLRQEFCHCVEAPAGKPFPCTTLNMLESLRADIGSKCQFVNEDLAYHRRGDGQPVPCCKKCNNPCGYECNRSKDKRFADRKTEVQHSEESSKEELCATSHKSEEDSCPPGINSCIRQQWGYTEAEQLEGKNECKKCWNNWKNLQSVSKTEEPEPTVVENESETDEADVVADAEYTEVVEEKHEEASAQTDEDILKDMLKREKKMLQEMKECFSDKDVRVRKQSIKVCALAGMLSDMENVYTPEPEEEMDKGKEFMSMARNSLSNLKTEVEHKAWKAALASSKHLTHHLRTVVDKNTDYPEFPAMKNNDQRKAFLNNYQTWPVWFEVPEASETYHRYDLSDGSSIVVCEYCRYIEWKKKETIGQTWYLLKPGYRYLYDCQSNETTLVEHLKKLSNKG